MPYRPPHSTLPDLPVVTVALALLVTLLAAGTAWAQPATPAAVDDTLRQFAVQVNASEDAALIAGQLDSLRRRGVPAYRTQTTSGGTVYHRLRVGPFPRQGLARRFAQCQGYSDPWVIPATTDSAITSTRSVAEVATDVLPLRPRLPRFLLGRQHAFAAFLMPAYGSTREGGARPATLRLYRPEADSTGRGTPLVIENVTGVRETGGGLEYGQAARVFIRRDTSTTRAEAIRRHADAIEAFSRAHGVSRYLVTDRLAFYEDGRVARFTLLGTLALPEGAPQVQSQPGFDYVGARGRPARYRSGAEDGLARAASTRVGHAAARRLHRGTATYASTPRVTLTARPGARGENAQVCVTFFEGKERGPEPVN